MAVALVLDQLTLPPIGTVKLYLDYTFELKVSAEAARRQVHRWLVDQVSYMIRADEPTLVISTTETDRQTAVWRVPAILTATHLGDVGVAGHVDVDVETGDISDLVCCKDLILQGAKSLVATMPPYAPRKDTPIEHLALDVQPTITRPKGKLLDILQVAN